MKAKWFINPFERIAGWRALLIGIVVMALTAVFGKLNHDAFDGVLDIHTGATFSYSAAFAMQAVDFLVLFLTMWLTGVCISKRKPCAIDVAGAMSLARTPMLLLTIVYFLPIVPVSLYDTPHLIVFTLISLLFIAWMVVLMYKAYAVSCHLRGKKRALFSFLGALLVAEFVSKMIIIFLLGSLFVNSPKTTATLGTLSREMTVVGGESLTIQQKTERIVTAFERSDFEAITDYFDAAMKKEMPPIGLKMAWIEANAIYGKFERADLTELKETRMGQYDIIEVPFFFHRAILFLRLSFNKDRTIGGLYLQKAD